MAKTPEHVSISLAGCDVNITNPQKVLFPAHGHTKLDLAQYYASVAEGALRGAGGRPNVLVRYPNGVGSEFFYQKRAPEPRPSFVDVVTLRFPSGRSAVEVVPRSAAALLWMANLGCLELHPHPVRAEDLEHPDELRVDLDPVPGVEWPQLQQVALVVREALADLGLRGWPKTSGSRGIHVQVRIKPEWTFDLVRRSALALAREVERRAPSMATSKWWKEERHGVFIDYNQNAKDRTVASAYSVRAREDARVSAPVTWEELAECDPADFTLRSMPARYAQLGDLHAGIDDDPQSLEPLLELVERQAREGQGDAPWPPHYKKQAGEPRRVQPSHARSGGQAAGAHSRDDADQGVSPKRTTGRQEGGEQEIGPGDALSAEHGDTAPLGPASAAATGRGSRRTSTKPLIEIARAAKKEEALAGLERWKERHPQAAAQLQAADVLVDAMRGRFTTWTRIRINLQHVSESDRPPQEALDPDFTPSWGPPRAAPEEAGQPARRRPSRARKES